MGMRSLVAFDTNHIKGYVFKTSRLKEIRGASSRLDHLNRIETVEIAQRTAPGAEKIYANGGSALFLVDTEKAELFGRTVQQRYRERTGNGASITYAVQPLPDIYDTYDIPKIMDAEIPEVLELLNRRLQVAGASNADPIALPSHPFLTPCSSCGVVYAEEAQPDPDDPENPDNRYCRVCVRKRREDHTIKDNISEIIQKISKGWSIPKEQLPNAVLWERILMVLKGHEYTLTANTERPKDFNIFADLIEGKKYLALIYADANGMGTAREKQQSLNELHDFAKEVDNAVFAAMGKAIATHLPVQNDLFPFDILLIGGDDIVMVVPADKAFQVAHTLADEFHKQTHEKYTLSVGVVLAPVKYPFNLQRTLAEEVLKAAKQAGSSNSKSQVEQANSDSQQALNSENNAKDPAYINFMVITGSTTLAYSKIYQTLHRKKLPHSSNSYEFYATMRPYRLDNLAKLLEYLRKGHKERLGRTKLHQLREAILKLNRTTTILEALATLRNWRPDERAFIEQFIDAYDTREQSQKHAETLFPWVHKPGKEASYETPLLDFIELYDFVAGEGGENV